MKVINLILLAGVIVFTSCSKDNSVEEYPTPKVLENFNFYKSNVLYTEAQKLRAKSYSDAFEIENVERTGNFLNVTLSYPEGCATNKFDVIWDGIILESWPMQINLIIKRSASGCKPNGKTKKETLTINLVELIDDKAVVEGTVFYVSNASKMPNEADADVTVSNKKTSNK